MRQTDHEGTWQILILLAIAITLALLLWNVAIRPANAAPLERTCYMYPVTLHHVACFAGWCSSWEDVHINGRANQTLTVRITGRGLRNGQIKPVRVCR